MKKKKSIIEYEDAPSGAINLYNYKTPLMKNDSGFGFQGVLAIDAIEDKVQCSECGWWGDYLPHHLKREHNMTAEVYKDKFGLNQKTALLNEKLRKTKILNSARQNLASKMRKVGKKFGSKTKPPKTKRKISMETRNNRASCPEQLMDRLKKVEEKLGRQPSHKEVEKLDAGLAKSLVYMYGGWNKVVKMMDWQVYKAGQGFGDNRWDKESLLKTIKVFAESHDRLPYNSDSKRKLIPAFSTYRYYFGSLKKAKQIAIEKYPELKKLSDYIDGRKMTHKLK